jgi:hypothetical protein
VEAVVVDVVAVLTHLSVGLRYVAVVVILMMLMELVAVVEAVEDRIIQAVVAVEVVIQEGAKPNHRKTLIVENIFYFHWSK